MLRQPFSRIKGFFSDTGDIHSIIRPGIHHYLQENDRGKARLHLRLEEDGYGILLVNASRVFHFNPTAAGMAYLLLEKKPENEIVKTMTRYYRVPENVARADVSAFSEQLARIIDPDGGCPICDLNLETTAPFSNRPSAPYRMDLAITYRCNNDCHHCYNARARQQPELDTAQWFEILDLLWDTGVPHIVFTGGEPTLRRDLPELIAHAERNGQITGINTNGRMLKNADLVKRLVDAGLDHIQITLESHLPHIHDDMVASPGAWQDTVAGLKNAVASKLYIMTNTTMLTTNSPYLAETIDFLGQSDVQTVGLNSLIYSGKGLNVHHGLPEGELPGLLSMARQKTEENCQRLVWYTPTQYCHFNPVDMELGVKGCTAALYTMCVEPDGSVIPCQSYYHSLGNILSANWDSIWNHELAAGLRERRHLPQACRSCVLNDTCGGGCPLARQAGACSDPVPVKAEMEALS